MEGKSIHNQPHVGKDFSLLFLPATPSSPSRTLEGLSELTQCPSRALGWNCALLLELRRYKDTVTCAELHMEVQGHHEEKLTQTLFVRLLKNLFFHCYEYGGALYDPPDQKERTLFCDVF